MDIKDLAGVSEPLKKLIETVSKGIGAVFEPYLIKKKATANVEVINKLAHAIKNTPQITKIVKYEHEGLSVVFSNNDLYPESLDSMERAEAREQYKNIKSQANIESIISQSVIELNSENSISDEEVNEDWITRYFNIIGDVSDDLMQGIWAKILAGEIQKPGSYSLRTLDLLRNLSKEEAILFNQVAAYALTENDIDHFLLHTEQLLAIAKDISYSNIITLIDLGLLSSVDVLYKSELITINNPHKFFYGDSLILIECANDQPNLIQFKITTFTKIGSQLLTLIKKTINEDYLLGIRSLINSNQQFTVSIADIINKTATIATYNNKREIK